MVLFIPDRQNRLYIFFSLPSVTSTSATGLPSLFLWLSEPSLHVERRRARNIQPTSNQLTQLVSVAFFLVFYLPPLFTVLLVCRLFFPVFIVELQRLKSESVGIDWPFQHISPSWLHYILHCCSGCSNAGNLSKNSINLICRENALSLLRFYLIFIVELRSVSSGNASKLQRNSIWRGSFLVASAIDHKAKLAINIFQQRIDADIWIKLEETIWRASPSVGGEDTGLIAKWLPSYDHPRVFRNESNN
jgi:hypothetical protein